MKDFLNNLTKKQKIIATAVVVGAFFIVFIFIYKNLYETEEEIIINNEVNIVEENEVVSDDTEKVIVHVVGEVNTPGVVTLEEGARIIDAINAAGGKTEEADLSKINLAYVVEDGTQIYIPRIGENTNETDLIISDAGEGIVTGSATTEETETKVNINTASLEKLTTLPGIGETTAQKIINYRETNGKFKTIEDIKNVSGIGDSKYETLKDLITV